MNQVGMTTPQFERALSRLMLAGVWSASLFLGLGVLLWLGASTRAASAALLRIGLFILMGTPMLRVALSVAESVRQRDWLGLAATLAVLVILLAGTVMALLRG
jgi:uncharacterized membrane protein